MFGPLRPNLRLVLRLVAALAAVCLLAAMPASGASKKDDTEEPQRMYEHALKSFKKGYYDEAITEWEKLRNTYPFSKFAVEAELKVADALYKKREYGDAADSYRTFAKLHPKHEQVDYATFRVGLSLFLEAPSAVDRDQVSTEKALDELRSFIKQFPDSKFADEAAQKIGEGRDRLAAKELYVGRYYVKHGRYHASLGRLKNVLDHYPDTNSSVEAQYQLGIAQWKSHDDAARATLSDFVEKHPDTEWSRNARKALAKLGGEVPKSAQTPTPAPSPLLTPGPGAPFRIIPGPPRRLPEAPSASPTATETPVSSATPAATSSPVASATPLPTATP